MYTLYTGKFTRGLVVEMVMAEGGIDFERHEVDILRGEERGPEYLAINPAGWVPALRCPHGVVLTETPAINLYLGERHRIDSLVPAADDPDRGPFLSGLFYLSGELEPALKRYWYPHYFGDGERTADAIRGKGIEAALAGFGLVEQRLAAGGPCYLGERFSLVDLTIAFWMVSLQLPDALRELPRIFGSVEIARARPKLTPLFDRLDAWAREYRAR
ncbi:MAG TPA: glutathione S-transferase family protein [Gammaproteobacteria bacterium]|nr:glutathione S-transferase family protein [Gammaproteobacteria bacterium]